MIRSWIKNLFTKSNFKKSKSNYLSVELLETRTNPTLIAYNGGYIEISDQLDLNNNYANNDLKIGLFNNILTVTEANAVGLTGQVLNFKAANGTIAIDLTQNLNAYRGLKVYLQDPFNAGGRDILSATDLDFSTMPGNTPFLIEFYGKNQNAQDLNNTLNVEGIISSKNNYVFIDGFDVINNTSVTGIGAKISAHTSNLDIKNSLTDINIKNSNGGGFTFMASTRLDLEANLDLGANLTLQGLTTTTPVNINSNNPNGPNSFTGINNNLTIDTDSRVDILGNVAIGAGNLSVTDYDLFSIFGDTSCGNAFFNSNINNSNSRASLYGNVKTLLDFTINDLGSSISNGAQFYINKDALPIFNGGAGQNNLIFQVGNLINFGDFKAQSVNGGKYDLYLCGNQNIVSFDATFQNAGSLTVGTLNIPSTVFTPSNNSVLRTVNGSIISTTPASQTYLFADVIANTKIEFDGMVNIVEATSGTKNRTFLIQALGNDSANTGIKLNGGVTLQNSNGFFSNLSLLAGSGIVDIGDIEIQGGVQGQNNLGILTIIDCNNFTLFGNLLVGEIRLQNNSSGTLNDASNGTGKYTFNGNIGTQIKPVNITTNNGQYGIHFVSQTNYFGPNIADFLNSGKVILGDNKSDLVSFAGGAIFREGTQVAGTGTVDGPVRIQGELIPGNFTLKNQTTQQNVYYDVGSLTFQKPVIFEKINPANKAVYYVDLLGNTQGISYDNVYANSTFTLVNNPLLYPIYRDTSIIPGTRFTIIELLGGGAFSGSFSGFLTPTATIPQVIPENGFFYAGGAKYKLETKGGDGNDVVITYIEKSSGTVVFVDNNHVLNVLGDDNISDVTAQMKAGSSVFGLFLTSAGSNQYQINPSVTFGGTPVISATAYTTLSINSNLNIISGGTGYQNGQLVSISDGINSSALATVSVVGGSVNGITLVSGGGGYLDLSNLSLLGTSGTLATISATGRVDAIHLTNGGFGYSSVPVVTIANPPAGNAPTATATLENVLNISDLNYGLSGFAYGSNVINNSIDIKVEDSNYVGLGQFTGFKVQLNGGNDKFNLSNVNLINVNKINSNVNNVYFSFNGGPSLNPSLDTDIFNIVGVNQNVETGTTGNSTVLIQGFDLVESLDLNTGLPATGELNSANQGLNSLKVLGPVNFVSGNKITLGSLIRTDTVNNQVPLTPGTITLAANCYIGDGVTLQLGTGDACNINVQSLGGISGGLASNIIFNASRFSNPVNNLGNTVSGGNIVVFGSIGTDIGLLELANSGITIFSNPVDAAKININNNDGGVSFFGQVGVQNPVTGFSYQPDIFFNTISAGSQITFYDKLYASSISCNVSSSSNNYRLAFLADTYVINNTSLNNTGGIIFGDSFDYMGFWGGLTVEPSSQTQIYALLESKGTGINIGSKSISTPNGNLDIGITLNGPSVIRTNYQSQGQTSNFISLGRIYSNTFNLELDAGDAQGSYINIYQARGDSGQLDIINSYETTIGQVGLLASNLPFNNEIFGSIRVRDTATTVTFNGGMLLRNLITETNPYSFIFRSDINALPQNTILGRYILLNESPIIFKNRGDLTLGVNGFLTTDPDQGNYILFKGGLNSETITGSVNLGAEVHTVNSDLLLNKVNITSNASINTYFSSVPSTFFFTSNEDVNIANLVGYPTSTFQLPQPKYPLTTGNIGLGQIFNNNNVVSINAGGPSVFGGNIGANINIISYQGSNFETFSVLAANDVNFYGNVEGETFYFGNIAAGNSSSNLELLGTVSIQGNFNVSKEVQVTADVNNFAVLGNLNTFKGVNYFGNSGFVQLGNSKTDQFNSSAGLNLRGAGERRIGGIFSITNSTNFDLGPGPTTLIADTEATTEGIGYTSLGALTNNKFDLTINGRTQIQRYANDSTLAPYQQPTAPPSYIPVNNILGAGTGGGDVFLNGEVVVQSLTQAIFSGIELLSGGSNYQNPIVSIIGGGGAGARATVTMGLSNNFQTILGGSNYQVGDSVQLQPVLGGNVPSSGRATVSSVDPNGAITGLNLTNPGFGYSAINLFLLNVVGGSGSGAVVSTGGTIVSINLTSAGAGYTSPPQIAITDLFGTGSGANARALVSNYVGFPQGNIINIPPQVNLKKQGTGNVTISTDSSANTAGLVTTIENGAVLYEGGKINAATITNIANNGMLGGSNGTLGTVNVLPGGSLAPGNLTSPVGTLNMVGDLTIQGNYNVSIRSQAFNLFDRVNVTGTVTLTKNGVSGVLNPNFTNDANSIAVGDLFGIISNDGTDAVVGTFTNLPEGGTKSITMPDGRIATVQVTYKGNILPTGTSFTGGNDVVLQVTKITAASSSQSQVSNFPRKLFAVSTDAGGGPVVKINFDDGSGFSFFAYAPTFTGGVRTAIGDINGDGQPDLVTAAGPGGGPHVIVWSINPALSYATVQSGFFAFEPNFTGGLTLSTGNLNGDTFDDIIVGAGAGGGPRVAAFAGNSNYASNPTTRIADFFAYDPSFNKGVNVAAGDVATGQFDEIITGAGQGGAPHVAVWQNSVAEPLVWNKVNEFFAFSPSLTCGVFVGAGDLDSDGIADIYTGTGSGTIATAGIFFGNGAVTKFEPFGQFFYGGVRVGAALGPVNQTGNTSVAQNFLIAAAGPGGGPQVSIFNGNLNLVDAFFAFPQNFTGGVLASTTVNR